MCSGIGTFLGSLTDKNCTLSGIELNKDNALISKIRLSILESLNYSIINKDALTYKFNEQFSKIFCEFPLNLRVNEVEINKAKKDLLYIWDKPGLTADWLFLNKTLTLLKEGGKAAIIVPDGLLFKVMDASYRRDILVSGVLKCVIKLPTGIIPNTNTSANIIYLAKNNESNKIKFIDASHEYIENKFGKRKLNVNNIIDLIDGKNTDETKVKVKEASEICQTDDVLLSVSYYLKNNEHTYINSHLLKEYIVEKFRGYQFTANEQACVTNSNGDYFLLTISDIEDASINEDLLRINSNNGKYDRYILKDGDVVISARGTRIKAAVVETRERKIIPNGNLLVIRLDTNCINPYYLQAFLNSENGKLSLEEIQTGAVIMSINPSRIERLKVPMVDKQAQDAFACKYKSMLNELYKIKESEKKLKSKIDNIFACEIEENANIKNC